MSGVGVRKAFGVRALALALVVLCLESCEDSAPSTPPASTPAPIKKNKAAALDAGLGDNVVAYQYVFNPTGLRDPFQKWESESLTQGEPSRSLCGEVLCQWDLEQLKLVAVVSGDSNPLAMVEDPSGVGHMVRRNAVIGRKAGKVTQILNDCIVVVEYWKGPDGKMNATPLKLCIKGDESAATVVDLRSKEKQD